MSSADEKLKQIEKIRYLIPCKCKICNSKFSDVMMGIHHISKEHRNREVTNVIDNLTWNIEQDLKKWEILQDLKATRDKIIAKLNSEKAIDAAKIPDVVEIQRKKADISPIIQALLADLEQTEKKLETGSKEEAEIEVEEEEIEEIDEDIDERDFESSNEAQDEAEETEKKAADEEPAEIENSKSSKNKKSKKRNLRDLLEREVVKYLDAIKRLTMASQVEQALRFKGKKKIKLNDYADQLDYFLGVSKAVKIIKESKQDLEIVL